MPFLLCLCFSCFYWPFSTVYYLFCTVQSVGTRFFFGITFFLSNVQEKYFFLSNVQEKYFFLSIQEKYFFLSIAQEKYFFLSIVREKYFFLSIVQEKYFFLSTGCKEPYSL